jgi:hypothetical protein
MQIGNGRDLWLNVVESVKGCLVTNGFVLQMAIGRMKDRTKTYIPNPNMLMNPQPH